MIMPEEIVVFEPYNVLPPAILDRVASRAADMTANQGETVLYTGDVFRAG
jgi:hypothetical protein